mgnify:CR=1 FL=1
MLFYLDLSKLAILSEFFRQNPLPFRFFFVFLQSKPRVTGNAEVRPVSVGAQARQGFWDAGFHLVLFFYQWNRH